MIKIINELKDNSNPPYTMGDVENDICMFDSGYDAGKQATIKAEKGISREEMKADNDAAEILTRGGVKERYPGELRQTLYWGRLIRVLPDLSFMDEADKEGLGNTVELLVKTSTPYRLADKAFRLGIAYERQWHQ